MDDETQTLNFEERKKRTLNFEERKKSASTVTASRQEEVEEIGFEAIAELLLTLSPTIANLIERQARTEVLWQIAEEQSLVPKGMNDLGDLIMSRLRSDKNLQAIREVTGKSSVVPFEYAHMVREAKYDIRKNDKEIVSLIKDLNPDG